MKIKRLLLAFIFLGGMVTKTIAQADENFHIYLLAGQSNMAGRGIVDDSSSIVDSSILMLTKEGTWVVATDPVHFDKSIAGVGPAISFARTMLLYNKKVKIGLVPAAVGGSPISVWQPDSTYIGYRPYDDALQRTNIALQSGVLKGILWHQGESDNKEEATTYYLKELTRLIKRFRKEFRNRKLPFVAGELGYFHKPIINQILAKLPSRVRKTAVVSAEGLTAKPDNIHFTTAAARELGRRYALKMARILYRNIPTSN